MSSTMQTSNSFIATVGQALACASFPDARCSEGRISPLAAIRIATQ